MKTTTSITSITLASLGVGALIFGGTENWALGLAAAVALWHVLFALNR